MYSTDCPHPEAIEKGIDVAIAVDMIRMGLGRDMDVVVLFSSDQNLLPAVDTLIDHRICHVEVDAWTGAACIRLGDTQLPWCHFLNELSAMFVTGSITP